MDSLLKLVRNTGEFDFAGADPQLVKEFLRVARFVGIDSVQYDDGEIATLSFFNLRRRPYRDYLTSTDVKTFGDMKMAKAVERLRNTLNVLPEQEDRSNLVDAIKQLLEGNGVDVGALVEYFDPSSGKYITVASM